MERLEMGFDEARQKGTRQLEQAMELGIYYLSFERHRWYYRPFNSRRAQKENEKLASVATTSLVLDQQMRHDIFVRLTSHNV